ncbi:MAG: recombinase RecA [Candidatus Spechtbacteria bacterium RIFCSPHIGHO2_02_FULL_43_15b]|uniref:Protein RecA n=1 Tax=Candidatus Spechtbacteria bacterium RIFCSPHIGHO2_01_FULL_43_30 TaxID=1802158 RepID=A0A1G2H7R0_9BACT|nr:MAG: recombinase RecA [Candidatus Spechtbacteria bacterium RIFCSPHIGHO2_01_FULL_43_30]OGZ60435.1 MAG: recombinase RecA [Candidatus Spechtbacteria bacterium RIFCSPHIGHO2_02_FULL_43_15b]
MPKATVKKKEISNDLEITLSDIRKRFGEGSIMRLGDAKRVDVSVISTGSISMDLALTVNGVPRGRITEVFGPESSGKTTLALHIAAQAQKAGGIAAFVDAEHALDPDYAGRIGLNVKDLLVSQPDTGEQALDIVEALVRSAKVDVIIIDSVAALTPRAEIEGDMGDHHIGTQARLMSQALRKLTPIVHKTNTAVIFINQIRMQIGIMFGNPETTPGGKALKFFSSVRIDLRRNAQIKSGEQIIGNRVKAKVVKNKVGAPFRTAEFDIMYNEGISYLGDLLNTGIKYEVLSRGGAWFNFGDMKLGQGMEASKKFLKDNPKIVKDVEKLIREKAKEA